MFNKIIENFRNLINSYVKKDKINHAYLLETNYNDKMMLADELINKIMSYEENYNLEEMKRDHDLTVIDPSSNNIKAEEIETLKEKYKTKSINNGKRIYVINNAERLNDFASNKLLKFLEEPEDDIIAILITENKNNLLKTIISRCQLIRFFINIDRFENYDEEYTDYMFNFINNIEENKEDAIAFQNIINIKKLSDRVFIQRFLNDLLYIYSDVLHFKTTRKIEYFQFRIDQIENISEKNSIDQIRKKINGINFCIERLKYNPNIKLLIDKLIIEMSGVEIE